MLLVWNYTEISVLIHDKKKKIKEYMILTYQ